MKFELSTKKFDKEGRALSKPKIISRENLIDQLKKAGYEDPTLIVGYGAYYYCCDRAPTSSEPDCYTDIPDFLEIWWDQANGKFYLCSDNTEDAMVWNWITTNLNLADQVNSLGIPVPTARSRSNRSSPAFGTSYQPSLTNDIELNLSINFNALLAFSAELHLKVSTDNTNWDVVAPFKKALSLGANENWAPGGVTIPKGCYYKIDIVSGNPSYMSILFLKELVK
jgi:hypothetical protein